jgi:hypothetical protein
MNHLRSVTSRNNRNAEDTSQWTSAPAVTTGPWVEWEHAVEHQASHRHIGAVEASSRGPPIRVGAQSTSPASARHHVGAELWLCGCMLAALRPCAVERSKSKLQVPTLAWSLCSPVGPSPNPSLIAMLSSWSRARQPHKSGLFFSTKFQGGPRPT